MGCLSGCFVVAALAAILQALLPAWYLYSSDAEACRLQVHSLSSQKSSEQRYVLQAAVNWYFGSRRLQANLTVPASCTTSAWRCEAEAFLFSLLATYRLVHVPERCLEASAAVVRDPRRWYLETVRRKRLKPQDLFCQSLLDYEHLPAFIIEASWSDVDQFVRSCQAEYKQLQSDLRHILDPLHSQGRVPEHLLRAHRRRPASSSNAASASPSATSSATPCLGLVGNTKSKSHSGSGSPSTGAESDTKIQTSESVGLRQTLAQQLGCGRSQALAGVLAILNFTEVQRFGRRSQRAGEALLEGRGTVVDMAMLTPKLNLSCPIEVLAELDIGVSAMVHHSDQTTVRERFARSAAELSGSCSNSNLREGVAGLHTWLRRFPKPTHSLYLQHEAFQSSTRLHLLQPHSSLGTDANISQSRVAFSNSDAEATLLTQVTGSSLVLLLLPRRSQQRRSSQRLECSKLVDELFQEAARAQELRCDASRWLWLQGAEISYAQLEPGEAITIPPWVPYLVVSQEASIVAASSILLTWPTLERVSLEQKEEKEEEYGEPLVQAAVRHFSLRTLLRHLNSTGQRLVRTPAGVQWP